MTTASGRERDPTATVALADLRLDGGPVTTTWWPKKSWFPVLKKLGIRRRKFYATRHTFISWALTQGMNLKAIAEYVGTSVAMIENSYGRFISDRGLAPLVRAVEGAKPENGHLAGTFASQRPAQKRKLRVFRGLRSGPRGNRTAIGRSGRHSGSYRSS